MKYIVFLFAFLFSTAQEVKLNYSPSQKDSVINYISTNYDKQFEKFNLRYKKEIKKIILERKQDFIKKIEDSTFIFDKNINIYVKSILNEIYTSNSIKGSKDFYFFIEKSPIPNAACYGNGIFTINLGLFNFVKTDDELAFILSHEIAHFILEHNDKNLLKYIETVNSKETKKKIKDIEKQVYGKRKVYSDFIEGLSYNFLNRSRKAEIQADSLGIELYKKTKFDIKSSITSLQNLDPVDEILFQENSKIKEHFNFENYPFKEDWIKKEQIIFDLDKSADDYSLNKDSLKTHPDIPIRVDFLKKMIKEDAKFKKTSFVDLKKIKEHINILSIKNFLDDKKLDFAFYQVMVQYNKGEISKKSYCIIISNMLQTLYQLKLNHTFGKYIPPVSAFSDEENLNEVRLFLNNVELKNIKKIGLYFCLKYQDIINDSPEFNKTTFFFKQLNQ